MEYIEKMFDEYEKEGFSKVFISPYDLEDATNRQGTPFKVVGRAGPRLLLIKA